MVSAYRFHISGRAGLLLGGLYPEAYRGERTPRTKFIPCVTEMRRESGRLKKAALQVRSVRPYISLCSRVHSTLDRQLDDCKMQAKCWIISAFVLLSGASTTYEERSSQDEPSHIMLRRSANAKPPQDPHMLPQCVKHEPGCKGSTANVVLELLDPVAWFVNQLVKTKEHVKEQISMHLYQQTYDSLHCQGDSEHNFFGGKHHYHRKIAKNKCDEWHMLPMANISMNYRLPDTKIDNHCDITFFDGKECTGNEVYKLHGALGVQMINGQSFCHVMQYPKSVFVGPCT
ncbi:hypothetical protein CERZMDRAFT_93972 [Cercospora zeae-maydis SCOH1-5]|uniref:Uncharacterized protein n=1 Tax=Cercospora zeae-maydis SCOH1-5 TaxID=717836 RepID=A0A6A6FQ35_9PEZI|nr:hypothetical protein CERZMDRAFT_93972 [Cercospora zeae-maydis SCOH1-5]